MNTNTAQVLNIVKYVYPRYQLGSKQREVWSTLTVAQQVEANRLMADMTATKALAAVRA
jgi:hypothetical protein